MGPVSISVNPTSWMTNLSFRATHSPEERASQEGRAACWAQQEVEKGRGRRAAAASCLWVGTAIPIGDWQSPMLSVHSSPCTWGKVRGLQEPLCAGPPLPASHLQEAPGAGECQAPHQLTVVLPLDERLPLPEPLHADAVDDARRLLGLEGLVQLGRRARTGGDRGQVSLYLPSARISQTPPPQALTQMLKVKNQNRQISSNKMNTPTAQRGQWQHFVGLFNNCLTQLRPQGRC